MTTTFERWYVRYPPDANGVVHETKLMPRQKAREVAKRYGGTVHYMRPVVVVEPEFKPRRPLWRILLGL